MEGWLAPKVMLLGLSVHVSPEGDTEAVSVTVPVKPSTGATVIVEVPVAPARTVTVVGDAEIEKSFTMIVTEVEWLSVPLAPVIVTVYTPTLPLQERAEVAEDVIRVSVTLLGLREHARPVDGAMESERLIVPVKPPVLVSVIVELADWPALTAIEVGFAEIVKSPRA